MIAIRIPRHKGEIAPVTKLPMLNAEIEPGTTLPRPVIGKSSLNDLKDAALPVRMRTHPRWRAKMANCAMCLATNGRYAHDA